MKKLLLLIALVFSFTSNASEKIMMLDYVGTDMDRIFEVKTNKYDKVTLDCQTFIQGMTFYNNSQIIHNFYIDSYQCEGLHDFLQSAKDNKIGVCFEIEDKSLNIVEAEFAECQ